MMVPAKQAYDFVNSHDPVKAQLFVNDGNVESLFIISEEVDRDGRVSTVTDIVHCVNGEVNIECVRDILGY